MHGIGVNISLYTWCSVFDTRHWGPLSWLELFCHDATALVGQCLIITEDSWSYSDTTHSVGFLWTSDQSDVETSIWQHTTLTRDKHPYPGGIPTHNSSKWAVADPRLRPRNHWDRFSLFRSLNNIVLVYGLAGVINHLVTRCIKFNIQQLYVLPTLYLCVV
jgi:hypothetical protein